MGYYQINRCLLLNIQCGPFRRNCKDEAKRRTAFTREIQPDFVFNLHHAIRDFFDFSGEDSKHRNRDQLSLYVEPGETVNDADNGHYRLDKHGELVRRAMGKYCSTEEPGYTRESNAFQP